jgi:hypothetical protein
VAAEATHTRRATHQEVLNKDLISVWVIVYFQVKQSSLAAHCMDSFPRDYYRWVSLMLNKLLFILRTQDVTQMAECMKRDHCPWDFNSLLETYKVTTVTTLILE